MNMDDLNNLDYNNMGSWPGVAKAGAITVLCVAILAGGFYFDTQDQIKALESSEKKEIKKRKTFEKKQKKAANLIPLQKQLEEMKLSLGAMLKLLPNKAEIEGLLVDISQTGLAAGLEFELFQPLTEKPIEFYAEKPIKLKVVGTYHDFGEFVSGVAALPRIVTQHNITIKPAPGRKKGSGLLIMEATAKTYRYLDEDEIAKSNKSKKNSKKSRRRK